LDKVYVSLWLGNRLFYLRVDQNGCRSLDRSIFFDGGFGKNFGFWLLQTLSVVDESSIFGKQGLGTTIETKHVEVVADQVIGLFVQTTKYDYELINDHSGMGHARLKLLANSFACSRALDKERRIDLKPLFEVSVEDPNVVQ